MRFYEQILVDYLIKQEKKIFFKPGFLHLCITAFGMIIMFMAVSSHHKYLICYDYFLNTNNVLAFVLYNYHSILLLMIIFGILQIWEFPIELLYIIVSYSSTKSFNRIKLEVNKALTDKDE